MKIRALPILQGPKAPAFEVRVNDLSDPTPSIDSLSKKIPLLLQQHKALILQSTADESWNVEDFGQFVTECDLEYYPYIGGAAPRTIIPVKAGQDIIFTANERYANLVAP